MAGEAKGRNAEPTKPQEAGFEENLKRLEEIVSELEGGNLPLDRSLELYEEGMKAYKTCQDILQRAEARVARLVETLQGELKEEPFEVPEGE